MSARAPGRPAVLSRPLIVAAARWIADHDGLDAMTVRAVAQRLGTGQASLYRHIADRRELLVLLADDVAARLPLPREGLEPGEQFTGQWLDAYDYLRGHHWAARIIAEGAQVRAGGAAFADSALAVLTTASGADRGDALRAFRVLWHLMLGHLVNSHPVGHPRTHEDAGTAPGPHDEPSPAPGTQTPAPPSDAARDDFAWALPLVLAGLRRSPETR
ncbi:TetR/AcrR family transcriptional regulator [Streptantibioticus silvisoli]|uniref:TetR family transcriptional regulator n=1 Tax=Streptantibioticus silvisoli TaxID=2705255 RepID=A0ABT6VT22_9ACTN|nr:TetR family transcriptional regulator [Streptantibioticus silvisoli]MDI5961330.1 TetR family transcriptional regulator [Streptantibioticus silvisoli]